MQKNKMMMSNIMVNHKANLNKLSSLFLAILLAMTPIASQAVDLSSPDYSETDASNTSAVPNGWPNATFFNQVEPIGRATLGFMKRFWNRLNAVVTSGGSSGAYTYTPANTSYPTAYVTGETYTFIANMDSVGSDTLNINSLGALGLYKPTTSGPAAISAADIKSGAHVMVQYDGALNSSAGGFYVLAGLNTSLTNVAIISGTIDGVSIGNTTPITSLHVAGAVNGALLNFDDDTLGRDLYIGSSAGGAIIGGTSAAAFIQGSNSVYSTTKTLELQPFGGAVTAPTPSPDDNTTNVATTAFVTTATGGIISFSTPTNSAGLGHWQELPLSGGTSTLPAGGTWAYSGSNNGTGFAGVAAGGTVIFSGSASNFFGFCWRVQ